MHYRYLIPALGYATSINRLHGYKRAKVIVDKGRYRIVDHSWERNI